jgi:hypothetical protein
MRSYKKVFKESSMGMTLDELKSQLSTMGLNNKSQTVELEIWSRPHGLAKGVGINLKGTYFMVFYPKSISFMKASDKDNSFHLYQGLYYLEIKDDHYILSYGGVQITMYI